MDSTEGIPQITVAKVSALKEGGCQGCHANYGEVFQISLRGWISRLCQSCADEMIRQIRRKP